MNRSSEQLLETLLDLEHSRLRERDLRIESDILIDGLRGITVARDMEMLFRVLVRMLHSVIEFEEAFILQAQGDGLMVPIASTAERLRRTVWHPASVFHRALAGRPVALFDVGEAPEWAAQPCSARENIKSALHIGLNVEQQAMIFVVTHSNPRYFGPAHIKQVERFVPLMSQALLTLDLHRVVTQRNAELTEANRELRREAAVRTAAEQALRESDEVVRRLNEELEAKVQERTRQLLAAQEALVRKEKLAVLGQVVGSVGHELRNPLGVMNNAVYFLKTVLTEADSTVREYLDIIGAEIAGAERIVAELLDSVRTKPPQPQMSHTEHLVRQALRHCTVPEGVAVEVDIPAELTPIQVDPQHIQRVFRNLIANGIDAMAGDGHLTISASADESAETIRVSVRDTGGGIAPEQMTRLFQPLYTTKARGIGLGLMICKNLVEANGGRIEVESELGKGAVFAVVLPTTRSG